VVKASQAISGEIVLDRLIETLMTIALEDAGAERGLLILLRGDRLFVEAEARTTGRRSRSRYGTTRWDRPNCRIPSPHRDADAAERHPG